MVVRNEYLPCFRQITSKFMPVTEKDLLDLSSIDPDEPGNWAMWAHMPTTKWHELLLACDFLVRQE
jgi:hypothetical protein